MQELARVDKGTEPGPLSSQQQPLNKNKNTQSHTKSSNGSDFVSEADGDILPNNNLADETSEEAVFDSTAEPKGISYYFLNKISCDIL